MLILGSRNGTCIMSPFWRYEFRGGFSIFGKCLHSLYVWLWIPLVVGLDVLHITLIWQRQYNFISTGTKPNQNDCVLVASVQRIQYGSAPDHSPANSGFEPSAVCPAEEYGWRTSEKSKVRTRVCKSELSIIWTAKELIKNNWHLIFI